MTAAPDLDLPTTLERALEAIDDLPVELLLTLNKKMIDRLRDKVRKRMSAGAIEEQRRNAQQLLKSQARSRMRLLELLS